jgi:hypothetical protein
MSRKTDPSKLEKTTINWSKKFDPIQGWKDWRLQWVILALMTVLIYAWLW